MATTDAYRTAAAPAQAETTGTPESIPLKRLRQCNPGYQRDLWQELDDLYRGGYAIQRRIGSYVPMLAGEMAPRYQDRLKSAAYISYFGQIVDYFVAALFTQEITMTPAADAADSNTPGSQPKNPLIYSEFGKDADLQGNGFASVLRSAVRTALVKQRALIALDLPAPDADEKIDSLADEEEAGTRRPYIYELPVEQLIDWEYDDYGRFSWAILHREKVRRDTPSSPRVTRLEWKIWQADGSWALYAITKPQQGSDLPPETVVPRIDEGETSFKQVPIVELEMPDGLWVGNKIGPLAKEHLQRRTSLVAAENRSLVTVPVVYRGAEYSSVGGEPVGETQEDPHRGEDPVGEMLAGKGFVLLGAKDKLAFEEPAGGAYGLVDKQLGQLKDEMFRIVERMAASVDNASGLQRRSGFSKQQDRAPEAIVLGAMGEPARRAATKIYNVISESVGDDIVWTPHGLDNYDGTNRQEVLQEGLQMSMLDIPSPTFKKLHTTQIALKLVANAPPDTQATIREEIEAGIDAHVAIENIQREQMKAALDAGTETDALPEPGDADAKPGDDDGDEPPARGKPPRVKA